MESLLRILILFLLTTIVVGQPCFYQLSEPSGLIESSNYPGNYQNGQDCTWIITASAGNVIELTVLEIDIFKTPSCVGDNLTIYDGTKEQRKLSTTECGTHFIWPKFPTKILSSGNMMTLSFLSDSTNTSKGFSASYQEVETRKEFFLITDATDGRILLLDKLSVNVGLLYPDNPGTLSAVGFDPKESNVYFTDRTRKRIGRINLAGGSPDQTIVDTNIDLPDGLAVDAVSRLLFWTDAGLGAIYVSNLDGSVRSTLIETDIDEPLSIVVDSDKNEGYIYWTDIGSRPRIERARTDGTYRESLITTNIQLPHALALDKNERKLYWIDAYHNHLHTANLDGTGRQPLVRFNPPFHPFSVALDSKALYWTNWERGAVEYVSRDEFTQSQIEYYFISIQGPRQLGGISLYKSTYSLGSNVCSENDQLCDADELCLPIPNGHVCKKDGSYPEIQPPVILNCPQDKVVEIMFTSSVPVFWIEPTATDDSDVVILQSQTHVSGSSFGEGVTEVVYAFADIYGNIAHCRFFVIVDIVDVNPPVVIFCPPDIHITVAFGVKTATVSWTEPRASDNSGSVTIQSQTATSGSEFPVGDSLVRYVFEDAVGLTTTCQFTISVIAGKDSIDPVVTSCPTDITIRVEYGEERGAASWTEPQAMDNSGSVTSVSTANSGSEFPIGDTKIVYVFEDSSQNTATCRFIVSVIEGTDLEPPTLQFCPEDITVTVDNGEQSGMAAWDEPRATDNSGSVTLRSRTARTGSDFPIGDSEVVYIFQDESGHTVTCSFTVTVSTAAGEYVECPNDITKELSSDDNSVQVQWDEPSSSNTLENLQVKFQSHRPGESFQVGDTEVMYEYTNEDGMTLSCKFTIHISKGGDFLSEHWMLLMFAGIGVVIVLFFLIGVVVCFRACRRPRSTPPSPLQQVAQPCVIGIQNPTFKLEDTKAGLAGPYSVGNGMYSHSFCTNEPPSYKEGYEGDYAELR